MTTWCRGARRQEGQHVTNSSASNNGGEREGISRRGANKARPTTVAKEARTVQHRQRLGTNFNDNIDGVMGSRTNSVKRQRDEQRQQKQRDEQRQQE
jgi:hypothetical protein